MKNYAVIFDMDGTILDNESLNARFVQNFLESHSLVFKKELFLESAGAKRGLIKAVMKINPGIDENWLENTFWEARKDFTYDYPNILRPTAKSLFEAIKANGYKLALASSTLAAGVGRALDSCGIRHYFDLVLSGDMVENGKPHPEMYLLCCEKLGIPPENCLCVEDSQNGVRSAAAAGLKIIALKDEYFGFDLSLAHAIMDFSEINIDIINKILKGGFYETTDTV